MCNRAEDRFSPHAKADLEQLFGPIFTWSDERERINPTDPFLAVRPTQNGYDAPFLRWGLIPNGKTPADLKRMTTTNARIETLEDKPTYRPAFLGGRRCIVPMSAYFEPDASHATKRGERKRWHRLARPDGRPLLAAGLWERTHTDDGPLDTLTVVTRAPVDGLEGVHDRMPALLLSKDLDTWLHGEPRLARAAAMTGWRPHLLTWTTT